MIRRRAHMCPQLVALLQIAVLLQLITSSIFSLSISSSNKNSLTSILRNTNSNNIHIQNSASQTFNQHHDVQQQATTVPPTLVTTLSPQMSYVDSLAQAKQQNFNQDDLHQARERSNDHRLKNSEDRDDTVPLATINNHSRNNLPVARPPQYVDVSTLVGRDRNLNSTSSSGLQTISGSSASGASGLSAKSRSGLPECATQQVCNAIFVRMNYTQRLCECSSNYNWKCSNNLDPQDGHTIELTRKFDKRIYTQIKTCEPLREVRACKSPTDWTLLALQSERSGKAHYVVVCKCPTWAQLEGPFTHNHPPYANIPGIRVYGMLCSHQTARSSPQTYATYNPALGIYPEFPWTEALSVLNTTNLVSTIDSH